MGPAFRAGNLVGILATYVGASCCRRWSKSLSARPGRAKPGRTHQKRYRSESRRIGFTRADYIISGIPFSTIPAPVREQILRKTCDVLEPGGAFLVYQFSTRVLQDLKRVFGYVGRRFQPLNVLPAHLFICQPAIA